MMSCGCGSECCKQSDALLSGLSGILGELDPIHESGWFSYGAELIGTSVIGDLMTTVIDNIREAVNKSGYAYANDVRHASGYLNPFIIIEGGSGREYGSADHLKKAITDTIQGLGYRVNTGSINFYASTYNPQTGEPTQTESVGPNNKSSSRKPDCKWDELELTDYVACQLGITTSSAMVVGAVGGLLAVVLLSKAVR